VVQASWTNIGRRTNRVAMYFPLSTKLNLHLKVVWFGYSNIYPWVIDGEAKSGSGCWGTELSVGDMLFLFLFFVSCLMSMVLDF
jgi:hypothetical protein